MGSNKSRVERTKRNGGLTDRQTVYDSQFSTASQDRGRVGQTPPAVETCSPERVDSNDLVDQFHFSVLYFFLNSFTSSTTDSSRLITILRKVKSNLYMKAMPNLEKFRSKFICQSDINFQINIQATVIFISTQSFENIWSLLQICYDITNIHKLLTKLGT